MKPLPVQEREYRLSLLRSERRLIIPIKWFTLAVTTGLWLVVVEPAPFVSGPFGYGHALTPSALGLFLAYALLTLVETWALHRGRIGLDNVRPVTLVSYLVDVSYATLLVYFSMSSFYWNDKVYSDFYILYFLLVMRGFALLRTLVEMVLVNTFISVLLVLMLYLQQRSYEFAASPTFAVRLALIWLVMLMAWFIFVVMNQQKLDLIRIQERLLRSENLVRVGELAAGVAHEINNPLGIVIANAEYLKRVTPPDDPRREDIDAIHAESNRCKEIVRQLLAYANPKPAESVPVDPVALDEEVLNFVFPRGRSGRVEIVRERAPRPPAIRADPNLLKQALMNLYINARQAIPPDRPGRIVSRILVRGRPPHLVLEIEDDGVGIDPDDLLHVFDPFFTRKEEGTGLGLSMTQRVVESAGGEIEIDSERGKGTRVRLTFPPADRDPPREED